MSARVRARYEHQLAWALHHPRQVMLGAGALLFAAVASVPFLGTEFMPKLDEGYLLIETRRVPSTSLPQGISVSAEVERTLSRFPEVKSIVTNLGRPHEATETMALNAARAADRVRLARRTTRQTRPRRSGAAWHCVD